MKYRYAIRFDNGWFYCGQNHIQPDISLAKRYAKAGNAKAIGDRCMNIMPPEYGINGFSVVEINIGINNMDVYKTQKQTKTADASERKLYDVWFCHCGRIQLMEYEQFNWLREDFANRFIIRICQHCGTAQRVWLSEYDDGFAVNSTSLEDIILNPADLMNCRIIMDKGIQVPVITDNADLFPWADAHISTSWWHNNQTATVDTARLIRDVKDEDKLRSIAGYVSGIDWSGTPYEIR